MDLDHAEYDARPTIMIGVDPELDKMRRDYDGLSILLEKIALSIVHDVPEWAARLIKACTFLPQVGFLIAVEWNNDVETSSFPSSHNRDDVWEEFFVADGAVHYKNNRMRHLDEQFGDIYRDIAGIELSVIREKKLQANSQKIEKWKYYIAWLLKSYNMMKHCWKLPMHVAMLMPS